MIYLAKSYRDRIEEERGQARELTCKCGCHFEVRVIIVPGYADWEDINCPKCGEVVTHMRADMGYTTRILPEKTS